MRTDLMVNDFVLRAVRDKTLVLYEPDFRRNFVHVRDVADAFAWTCDKWAGGSLLLSDRVFNLGNDEANITKRQLCSRIAHYVDGFEIHDGRGSDPDKRDYIISNALLRKAGFEAKRSLDDGIQELIKLYTAFPQHQFGNV
jgi:nucleoside-diphosphate-sugar epimerase